MFYKRKVSIIERKKRIQKAIIVYKNKKYKIVNATARHFLIL